MGSDAGAIARQGGPTGTIGHWRPNPANIYYPLSQSTIRWVSINFDLKVPSVVVSDWNAVANKE